MSKDRPHMATTYLYDVKTGRAHAYTLDGENYYLADDSTWWAYQAGNHLYEATTGQPIAYWSGDHLYGARAGHALWQRA
ncbi:hypothetical protein HQ535_15715 [bacterium]|nr:hypothetical protein [bacterium]